MREFDRLPPALRRWLAHAALPWSPRSCRRIWSTVRAAGGTEADALARLGQAERTVLARIAGACATQPRPDEGG